MNKLLFLLPLLLFCASCQRCPLDARLEELTPSYLASCRVNTPDPQRCRFCGQQLVVSWELPTLLSDDLLVRISLITGKHRFCKISIPAEGRYGSITYQLVNDNYKKTGGILTYKVELFSKHRLLATYKPRSWVEWVLIED